jgi:nitroimidazol reductase NimA-like FMN-containing flavoprotein (pyridoxamine 5'-phosphate oxidase superfamily)
MAKIADQLKLTEQELIAIMQRESRLRIATIGPGSDINLTPMTFGWANGKVYIFGRGQKIANLRRNPTATVLVDIGEAWRELKGVMLKGRAEVLEDAQAEQAEPDLFAAQLNLGHKHGLNAEGEIEPYRATASGNSRRWIVFTPEKVVSWDNSKLP